MACCQAPVGSFFQRLPGGKHKSCHGMASTASSIFFYASFKKPLLWPSCYFSSLVPISRHALRPCRGMPCHVSSDCPVTSTSRAMSCLARRQVQVVPWHGLRSLVHFLLCIFQEAFVVAFAFYVLSCLGTFSQCPATRIRCWFHALAFFLSFSSRTSSEVLRKGNEIGREGEGRIGATQG